MIRGYCPSKWQVLCSGPPEPSDSCPKPLFHSYSVEPSSCHHSVVMVLHLPSCCLHPVVLFLSKPPHAISFSPAHSSYLLDWTDLPPPGLIALGGSSRARSLPHRKRSLSADRWPSGPCSFCFSFPGAPICLVPAFPDNPIPPPLSVLASAGLHCQIGKGN